MENQTVKLENVSKLSFNSVIIAKIVISLFVAVLSFTCLSNIAASPKFHKNAIEMLDQKRNMVIKLSAGTAVVANSASLILGDRALPIANKLMDLTGYFLLILCAIILEKYLLTILGLVSFKILLPLASLLFLANVFIKNNLLGKISIKLAVFSIIIFLVVPTSVNISHLIENTYDTNIQVLLDNTKEIKEEADKINNESSEIYQSIDEKDKNELENNNIDSNNGGLIDSIGKAFNTAKNKGLNFLYGAKNKITNVFGVISEKATQLFNKATDLLGKMIEAIAIMIVTTCIMPILVLLFFIWIVKMFFGLDIKTENFKMPKIFKK